MHHLIQHLRFALGVCLAMVMLTGCAHKPSPLSMRAFSQKATYYQEKAVAGQEPISHPLTLYEAMARAVKYNWSYQVKVQESKLRKVKMTIANYSMLPNIAANAGYSARNNLQASNSLNLVTREVGDESTTSQDKRLKTTDISFGWNILDFGLSYIRARQAGDQYLISQELRNKVLFKLLEDVRTSFWRAVAYEQLHTKLKKIEMRVTRAQRNSRAISNSGMTPRLEALTSERELVEIKQALHQLEEEIRLAKTQLAALINIRPGSDLKLATASHMPMPGTLPLSPDDMVYVALRDRSEMREKYYQQRINSHEAKAALLDLLPGLKLYAGDNWDSNSFLLNANWVDWGAAATWNLINAFQYPLKRKAILEQEELLHLRTLALSMSIISQVHISAIRYHQSRRSYDIAREFLDVQHRLLHQYRIEAKAKRVGEQKLLREELNALIAETKYDLAYADMQSAYANVFATLGWNPGSYYDSSDSVGTIAARLEALWATARDPELAFSKLVAPQPKRPVAKRKRPTKVAKWRQWLTRGATR